MKKFLYALLSFVILFTNLVNTVQAKVDAPTVSADGVVLMDAATGKILYSKNMDVPYPPASTTKIMTALLTLEKCKMNDTVIVGKKPPLADGSKIYILEGEELKVKDLLYAILIASANDCAEALAEHMAGSTEKFAEMMNSRAKELGCTNTNFVNPHGLYDDKHRTSAKDLALILQELSKYMQYKEISTAPYYKILPTNKYAKERVFSTSNKLIQKNSMYYYQGCDGGKTGYTIQSQHSYVAVACRNNQKLIVTLIHDNVKSFFPDSIALFDYGFNNFELVTLFKKDDIVSTYTDYDLNIPLLAEQNFYYVREKGDSSTAKFTIKYVNLSKKSFQTGDILTEATISFKNDELGTLKLLSAATHEIPKPMENIAALSTKNSDSIVYLICILSISIVIFLAIVIKNKKNKV